MGRFGELISGETLLESRANGGSAIFQRTLRISLITYIAVLLFVEIVGPDNEGYFSLAALREAVVGHVPWLGAIFAGIYVALYSRFASQWNYLATLYNQQMATVIEVEKDDESRRNLIAIWEAGFVEDARDVHLALKPMFAEAILSILRREGSRDAYLKSARSGGQAGLERFEASLESAIRKSVPTRGD